MDIIETAVNMPPADETAVAISKHVQDLSSTDINVVSSAINNLGNILSATSLVKNKGLLEHFRGAVPPLKTLIMIGAWEQAEAEIHLLRQALNVLFNYTEYGEHGVDMLMVVNILPALVTLLAHEDSGIQTRTVILIFGILHMGIKPDVIEALMESNFFDVVPDLLGETTSQVTKEYTWNCLSYILDNGNQEEYEMMLNADSLPSILNCVTHHFGQKNLEMKVEAGSVLIKLWENGLRHGLGGTEVASRLAPYNITRAMVNDAKRLCETEAAIIALRFARALGLNEGGEE